MEYFAVAKHTSDFMTRSRHGQANVKGRRFSQKHFLKQPEVLKHVFETKPSFRFLYFSQNTLTLSKPPVEYNQFHYILDLARFADILRHRAKNYNT